MGVLSRGAAASAEPRFLRRWNERLADVEELALRRARRFEGGDHRIERGVLGLGLGDFAEPFEASLGRAAPSRGELGMAENCFPCGRPTFERRLERVTLALDGAVFGQIGGLVDRSRVEERGQGARTLGPRTLLEKVLGGARIALCKPRSRDERSLGVGGSIGAKDELLGAGGCTVACVARLGGSRSERGTVLCEETEHHAGSLAVAADARDHANPTLANVGSGPLGDASAAEIVASGERHFATDDQCGGGRALERDADRLRGGDIDVHHDRTQSFEDTGRQEADFTSVGGHRHRSDLVDEGTDPFVRSGEWLGGPFDRCFVRDRGDRGPLERTDDRCSARAAGSLSPRASERRVSFVRCEVESSIGDHVPREGPRVGGSVVGAAEPIGHLLHAAWTAIRETVVVADAIEAGHRTTDQSIDRRENCFVGMRRGRVRQRTIEQIEVRRGGCIGPLRLLGFDRARKGRSRNRASHHRARAWSADRRTRTRAPLQRQCPAMRGSWILQEDGKPGRPENLVGSPQNPSRLPVFL